MNCEEATNLISARLDGELDAESIAPLDAHLAGCEECRRTQAELEIQDASLVRAFGPYQESAIAVANRVTASVSAAAPQAGRLKRVFGRVAALAAAAAVGFVAAIFYLNAHHHDRVVIAPSSVIRDITPVAELTFATGQVFTCPANEQTWTELSPHNPIAAGASVRTTNASKCELQLPGGSCVRLNAATEARFTADRMVKVSSGELWSAVAHDSAPLCVSTGDTTVTAKKDTNAQFDLMCATPRTVSVQSGAVAVEGTGLHAIVNAGQVLCSPSQSEAYSCTTIPDPLQASQWQDELLVLKPADNPEVMDRIDQLLTRITLDRRSPLAPSAAEQEIRSQGAMWCRSLALYLQIRPARDRDTRQTAARLLSDLAAPSSIAELIGLLDDEDAEVRIASASALHRLTNWDSGHAAARFAANPNPEASAAWRIWWKQNGNRYSPGK